ncbi:cyclin-J-like isoform X2 [Uloborus diversus]|nr:cyclin-J-like isoform X2 [Uloborus diversus]
MTTEKDWWVQEYAQDIHKHLRSKEKKRFLFRGKSPQLHMRKCLVEWLELICDKLEFCTPVLHLALYLLDIFMDNHTIHYDHLQMVALGCLTVAVKLEENDALIPKNSDLNALVGNKYKLIEFVQMEVSILTFFNWDILFPTAAHFVDYYIMYAVSPFDASNDDGNWSNLKRMEVVMKKYVRYFLEVSIQDVIFLQFPPSKVAASCLAATRGCLAVSVPWPGHLERLTGWSYDQLKPCVDLMHR